MTEPLVRIRGLGKSFGPTRVLEGVDLDVGRGEAVVVIGPSGSGKTTLLRCINVLETYDEGSVQVDGVEVGYDGPPGPGRRPRRDGELARIRADIGMVFQLFNLFPHLTALENFKNRAGKSKEFLRAFRFIMEVEYCRTSACSMLECRDCNLSLFRGNGLKLTCREIELHAAHKALLRL